MVERYLIKDEVAELTRLKIHKGDADTREAYLILLVVNSDRLPHILCLLAFDDGLSHLLEQLFFLLLSRQENFLLVNGFLGSFPQLNYSNGA